MEDNSPLEIRKIVPVIAQISAGKSTLLNTIYNIDFLECNKNIGTKFINILRYNPNIKEPKFFHLILKREDNKYKIYKDTSFQEIVGRQKILEENRKINRNLKKETNINFEKNFYMTEINESPFIKDENYLLSHDLCDIPGLSEANDVPINLVKPNDIEGEAPKPAGDISKLIEKKDNSNECNKTIIKSKEDEYLDNIQIDSIIEDKKEEDDLYYNVKVDDKSYIYEIFSIIKDYIDGGIIILNQEKYYFKENFELIALFHKITKKKITDFLIILNKIDLSENPENDIEKCKSYFLKYFPSGKSFNINLNTFIPLSTNQLKNSLLLTKNFKYLLRYHLENYISKIKQEKNDKKKIFGNTFIKYLRDIIKTRKETTKDEIEEKINNSEIIKDEEFIKIINELKSDYKEDNNEEGINFGIKEENFNINKEEEDSEDNVMEDFDDDSGRNSDIDEINPSNIIKILYIFQKENILIPPLEENCSKLINYFKIKENPKKQIKKNNINPNINIQTQLNKQIIDNLISLTNKIKSSKFVGNEIKSTIKNLYQTIDFLKTYNVIFIPFLGPSSAGKSTIINDIIGENILPTSKNECTKRGIIIGYDNDREINIRKAIFTENEFLGNKKYFFLPQNSIIAEGIDKVKETVKGLNYEYNQKEEDSFYLIRTKIRLFDELGLDSYLKKIIYLIDFPGYGTDNITQEQLYKKVMSICNAFIFVFKNSLIKEDTNKKFMNNLFREVMQQKYKLPSGLIKSCLFILNNETNQETSSSDLLEAKDDIQKIITRIDKEDINTCFFNAKLYSNYLENYNYFFNITKSIEEEYNDYYKNYYINKWKLPQSFSHLSFAKFFYKSLGERISKMGFEKIKSEKNINQSIINEVNEIINELESFNKIGKNEFTPDLKSKIYSRFDFGRKILIDPQTLKNSNIGDFKSTFLYLISNINDEMQLNLKKKIGKILKILDYFFNTDFSERKKDLKDFDGFKKNINNIIEKLRNCIEEAKNKIEKIKEN